MTEFPSNARKVDALAPAGIRYSICTLVTRPDQYREMVDSFFAHGFQTQDCEYLYIDNSERNRFDAFSGYNHFLGLARGTFIILCHQDIVMTGDDREVLDRRLAELTERDPHWALCGNAGGTPDGKLSVRITDPHGADRRLGSFPARVVSLDENFIVARRDANLALSRDLSGFHFYGADLCTIADVLGWNSYVVDFHLFHNSGGSVGANFYKLRNRMEQKYAHAFRSRAVRTTCTLLYVGLKGWRRVLTHSRRLAGIWYRRHGPR